MTFGSARRVSAKMSADKRGPGYGRRWAPLFLLLAALVSSGAHGAGLVVWSADPVPPVALPTLDGRTDRLTDHAGRAVLVHIFATWCEPCRDELATLDRLRARLAPRGLSVLAISSGEPESRVRRFFEAHPTGLTILLDRDRATMKAWGVETFPTTFVVGRSGCPLLRVAGEYDWTGQAAAAAIETALDEPAQMTCNSMGERP